MGGRKIDLDKGEYYVQIASFSDKKNAIAFKKKYENTVIQKAYVNGKYFYRVRITGFNSRKKAENHLRKIKWKFPGAYVVREN